MIKFRQAEDLAAVQMHQRGININVAAVPV
jgi:hypothetical protein